MVATTGCSAVGAPGAESGAADRLFVALDQHRIVGGPVDCLVEVSGVHEAPHGGAWVQIAVVGDPAQNVVLFLSDWTMFDHAIAALEVWGKTPVADRPASIDVKQTASLSSHPSTSS